MPQLSQEVNHFNKIYIVNLSMNQLIRKFISSDFVACSGCQNNLLPNVGPLLDCWSIPPLFGNGGVNGHLRKAVKMGIYPFGVHLLPVHLETDLLYQSCDWGDIVVILSGLSG
ncbi:hypothetical protein N8524_03675 [Candidatus Puniceispirillum sp.]|nr:hypothetical protein [Candidatus Puniceispirillum sp.]